MNVECFLDTNILVYAAAGADLPNKKTRALSLIEQSSFGLSIQVLQEFYVTVTRKAKVPLRPETALEWIEQWEAFPCVTIDSALIKLAAEMSQRFLISYGDAAIIVAAEALGANIVYSEDLKHRQQYGPVTVINPFLG